MGRVSVGLSQTPARLVWEVIYGVQSRPTVRLSEITRVLEKGLQLKKIVERLRQHLNRKCLRKWVRENLLELPTPQLGRETLLAVDLTHSRELYARNMEYEDGVPGSDAGRFARGAGSCLFIFRLVTVEQGTVE